VVQRQPEYLIENGYLEKLQDFAYEGKTVHASRLGYRITEKFVHSFFGKVFDNPIIVFDEAMLKPETQDMAAYVDGINNISEAQQKVAAAYFKDGSVDDACPPLQALLNIMAYGEYEGKTIDDPSVRMMFGREYLMASDWYQQRLQIKQQRDAALWKMNRDYVEQKMDEMPENETQDWARLQGRIEKADEMYEWVCSQSYLESLQGSLGADWIHKLDCC
jgi:hypothetical protein